MTRRKRSVRYLPAAENDLLEIFRWILKDAPARAASFPERLDKRIAPLSAHPELGRAPRHPKLQEAGYRVLVVDDYLAFYVVSADAVEIHRVVHGSRNLDEIV